MMEFILKKICESGVRIVGKYDSYEAAIAKKAEIYEQQEFSECFIDIQAPEGFCIAGMGAY